MRRLATLLALLLLAGCAAPLARVPRVVWVSGERAYVALRDSTSLEVGDRVRFQRAAKTVASGMVMHIEHGEIAQVTLTSGSVGGERELARTTVVAERSPLPAPSLLRIGLPSAARGTAFFACGHVGVEPQWPAGAYRVDAPSERLARFIRYPAIATDKPWPDTLLVRFYDESTDEEIAVERGELNVALFWPGELSGHMRASPRWRDPLMGVRSRGSVALVWTDSSAIHPGALQNEKASTFAALNRDLFGGDLLLSPIWPDSMVPTSDHPRFQVDPRCPGRAELQRYLDRHLEAPTKDVVRLQYHVLFRFGPGTFGFEGVNGMPLYAIRCPIVCAPELRSYLGALGVNQLADLIACTP